MTLGVRFWMLYFAISQAAILLASHNAGIELISHDIHRSWLAARVFKVDVC